MIFPKTLGNDYTVWGRCHCYSGPRVKLRRVPLTCASLAEAGETQTKLASSNNLNREIGAGAQEIRGSNYH